MKFCTLMLGLFFFGFTIKTYSQYDRGSIDFGLGVAISVGLQEEIGFDIRAQYTSANKITAYILEYNRFFRKYAENTEVYNEFAVSYNARLWDWERFNITGGVGYIGNDYIILNKAEDTSGLFFTTGNFNHGAQFKLRGIYRVDTSIHLFVEGNLKSFGRRYDSFIFGVTYALGI